MGTSLAQPPLLGGAEWLRRLEAAVHLRADAPGIGGMLRLEWGPWATLEIESRLYPTSKSFADLRIPFRWALSDDVEVAPFLGYSSRLQGVPLGLEGRFRRDAWMLRGAGFGLMGSERSEWRIQIDRVLKADEAYHAFIGAGLVWDYFDVTRDERSLYLSTGVRL